MQIKDNTNAYLGDGGQLRIDPVRKWGIDREWLHMGLGLLVWQCPVVAFLWALGGPHGALAFWAVLVVALAITHVFIRYELTEGQSINDNPYRDILGFKAAMIVVLLEFTVLAVLQHQFF